MPARAHTRFVGAYLRLSVTCVYVRVFFISSLFPSLYVAACAITQRRKPKRRWWSEELVKATVVSVLAQTTTLVKKLDHWILWCQKITLLLLHAFLLTHVRIKRRRANHAYVNVGWLCRVKYRVGHTGAPVRFYVDVSFYTWLWADECSLCTRVNIAWGVQQNETEPIFNCLSIYVSFINV